MNFTDFINEGKVRRSSIDKGLVKSLLSGLNTDLKFLDKIKIDEISARKLMVGYYDTLRSLLEAIASTEGYKIYSHEAFTFYLKEKGENILAEKFDRFRKIRNAINYYGKDIDVEECRENIKSMINVLNSLKNKYLKDLK
ncbi:hypothetical protein J4440_01755 [Candidatus Woesearchaeota archaeon]|nr:hypothetical protein [Candidatus Woesearchaeota archaeon]